MRRQRIVFLQTTVDDAKVVPYWGYFSSEPAVAWVAAAIAEPGWEAEIVDADQETDEALLDRLAAWSPSVIGFSCYTAGFRRAVRLSLSAKRRSPDVFCIFGGWHPSLVPEATLLEPGVDAVGVGQGERFINAFLRDPDSFRGRIIRAESYPAVERPTPLRVRGQEFARFHFPGSQPEEDQRAATVALSGGGCIFRCSYCSTPTIYGKGSPRRLEAVIAEIKELVEQHDVNFVFFRDENPPIYREFLEEFCDAMVRTGLNRLVRLYSFGDTRLMSRSLLGKMARAGWVGLDYGVESFDKVQLRNLRRSTRMEQTKDVFRWTREAGIFTTANVILWQPGDTIDCFRRTANGLRWLTPDEVIPLFFTPFPGTDSARQCENLPRRTDRLEDYHLLTPVLQLDRSVTTADLLRLRREMLNNYYLAPEYAELIQYRKQQFGESFWALTKARRDRLLAYGIDIWGLNRRSVKYGQSADGVVQNRTLDTTCQTMAALRHGSEVPLAAGQNCPSSPDQDFVE
jgi:anaerobic magnesium-protoporphyrin IX monomethyl ester cyclase